MQNRLFQSGARIFLQLPFRGLCKGFAMQLHALEKGLALAFVLVQSFASDYE